MLPFVLAACQDYDLQRKEEDPDPTTTTPDTTPVETGTTDTGTTDTGTATGTVTDPGATEIATLSIYLNTGSALYSYDPATNTAARIGSFMDGGAPVTSMTDIAIDLSGRMYGGSYTALYQINPTTAEASFVATLADEMTGLTFVSDGRLVGAGARVSFVDTSTGRLTQLVPSGTYSTSGDIIGLPDGMLYWSVVGGDDLVQVDPTNGDTQRMGEIGMSNVFGLGFADDQLYGFASSGTVLVIDESTGDAGHQQNLPGTWWGATTNPVLW